MQKEMQIILEVNIQAEDFYEDAISLGDHAAYALGKKHRAQMTGLESIAESAFKASDVLDYVKRQTGRFPYWQQRALDNASFKNTSEDKPFGERLKHHLEQDLAQKCGRIFERLKINGKTLNEDERSVRRHIYLLLIRQFVRQMVIQYEYRVGFEDLQGEGGR